MPRPDRVRPAVEPPVRRRFRFVAGQRRWRVGGGSIGSVSREAGRGSARQPRLRSTGWPRAVPTRAPLVAGNGLAPGLVGDGRDDGSVRARAAGRAARCGDMAFVASDDRPGGPTSTARAQARSSPDGAAGSAANTIATPSSSRGPGGSDITPGGSSRAQRAAVRGAGSRRPVFPAARRVRRRARRHRWGQLAHEVVRKQLVEHQGRLQGSQDGGGPDTGAGLPDSSRASAAGSQRTSRNQTCANRLVPYGALGSRDRQYQRDAAEPAIRSAVRQASASASSRNQTASAPCADDAAPPPPARVEPPAGAPRPAGHAPRRRGSRPAGAGGR